MHLDLKRWEGGGGIQGSRQRLADLDAPEGPERGPGKEWARTPGMSE